MGSEAGYFCVRHTRAHPITSKTKRNNMKELLESEIRTPRAVSKVIYQQ